MSLYSTFPRDISYRLGGGLFEGQVVGMGDYEIRYLKKRRSLRTPERPFGANIISIDFF